MELKHFPIIHIFYKIFLQHSDYVCTHVRLFPWALQYGRSFFYYHLLMSRSIAHSFHSIFYITRILSQLIYINCIFADFSLEFPLNGNLFKLKMLRFFLSHTANSNNFIQIPLHYERIFTFSSIAFHYALRVAALQCATYSNAFYCELN